MRYSIVIIIFLIFSFGCKDSSKKKEKVVITSTKACVPITSDKEWYNNDNKAPLFEGLGDLYYPISTNDSLVQRYFNQGLTLAYGFNHAEAARSFYYAIKLDPNCAMAFWGYAYVLGPNYNAGMESDNYERAYKAIQEAKKLSKYNTTEKERDLIEALSKRYADRILEDRSSLDQAYANAMKALYVKYPDDSQIGVLYAESLMNLHPWDLQDKNGKDKEWTPEIISTLEDVIEKYPKHPGAHHFYIHAVEASDTPDRALTSAELFDKGLVPNAGHLVHMPSHVYIRTGDYNKGTLANLQSIKVDSAYVTACNAQGVYPLAYYPHNQHFMSATATLEGNSKWAFYAAEALQRNTNKQLMKEPGWGTIQHYYTIPFYIYVKFGKWDDILTIENEVPELDYPTAILHYAKGMAYVDKGNIKAAKSELQALERIASNEELRAITIWEINSVYELLQIASKVLKAAILSQEKNYDQSIVLLKEAVAIEDALNYNEPPDWFFSVRHHLGAVQLDAGKYQDAINTYTQDLKNLPKNGWALKGLSIAYSKLGDVANQVETENKFNDVWKTSDIELKSSVVK
ncbi:tetratricopeptide repeat protein [Tenacibaculum aestuarii]|uniref:tetratricopeptide repeat protein n=1 Tax=Tenacibaculum aestuarii TaxID=362781 RepID=UPI00389576F2